MLRSFFLYLSSLKSLQRRFSTWGPARRFARRFVAGETFEDAVIAISRLNQMKATAALDLLGENVTSSHEAQQSAAAYIHNLDQIHDHHLHANISVKLTQLGLDIDRDLCSTVLDKIIHRATELENTIEIDMEGSSYTSATLDVVEAAATSVTRVGLAIQAYLYRSEKDIERLLDRNIKIRLVKGAYKEPSSIAFPKKSQVDAQYLKLAKILLDSGGFHAIATHDSTILEHILQYAGKIGRKPGSFEFQMLYGIRRDLQRDLVQKGHNLRVYVPYGSHWYPYFMRRLAERPANTFFILKNLFK